MLASRSYFVPFTLFQQWKKAWDIISTCAGCGTLVSSTKLPVGWDMAILQIGQNLFFPHLGLQTILYQDDTILAKKKPSTDNGQFYKAIALPKALSCFQWTICWWQRCLCVGAAFFMKKMVNKLPPKVVFSGHPKCDDNAGANSSSAAVGGMVLWPEDELFVDDKNVFVLVQHFLGK